MSGLAEVTAAVLAGGLGTRLRAEVADRPKVLALVHGKPFLSYLLRQLQRAGIQRAVVCVGYRGEQVSASLGETHEGMRLDYSQEENPLGTAGALRHAAPLLRSDTILVVNGDSYCDADLPGFYAWHKDRGARASILVTSLPDASEYGTVRLRDDHGGPVRGFQEKVAHRGAAWINAGVYLLEKDVLFTIPSQPPVSLERDVFPLLVGHGLYALPTRGRFLDIGTPERYRSAEEFFR